MTDLHSLLTRAEAATEPDRELDAYIMCALNGYTMHEDSNPNDGIFAFWDGAPWESTCHNCTIWPEVSASLDAALALVGEKLPEWTRAVDATAPELGIDVELFPPNGHSVKGTHALEPHATLIALLRALIAKQEVEDASA